MKVDVDCKGLSNTEVVELCADALKKWNVYADARAKLIHVDRNQPIELGRRNMTLLLDEAIFYTGHPRKDKKGEPLEPSHTVSVILAEEVIASHKYFPKLAGVTSCPVVSLTGRITSEGYDAATRLYVAPPVKVAASDLPTTPGACAAELLSLVGDFPFVDDQDRGAWLAVVLSGLMRPSIPGAVPAFVITATTRGTGKTLLATAAMDIIHGPGSGISTEPHNEEEAKKALLSEALHGTRVLVWDNLANGRPFGGAAIDSLITSDVIKGRALGGNTLITAKLPFVLVCTGNNVRFQADTARRVVLCRLETKHERPEDRQDYAIENLRGHITKNRARILGVAVQLVRLGLASDARAPRVGSFEDWGDSIGRIMRSAGFDLAPCFASADGSSDETALARVCLLSYIAKHWPNGASTMQIMKRAFGSPLDARAQGDVNAADAFASLSDGRINRDTDTRAAGRVLGSFERSNVAGLWMTRRVLDGTSVWVVRDAL